jgi:hypothetical protein
MANNVMCCMISIVYDFTLEVEDETSLHDPQK